MVSNQWLKTPSISFSPLFLQASPVKAYFSGLDIDPEEAGVSWAGRDGGDGW